jgi:hypothetical protein
VLVAAGVEVLVVVVCAWSEQLCAGAVVVDAVLDASLQVFVEAVLEEQQALPEVVVPDLQHAGLPVVLSITGFDIGFVLSTLTTGVEVLEVAVDVVVCANIAVEANNIAKAKISFFIVLFIYVL